jgi:hypothetical protein
MVRSASSRVSNHLARSLTPSFETPREARAAPQDEERYTATNSATPTTISAIPESSRAEIGCLNE